ncbi:MAG TPA: hypothetical protein VIJ68_03415 [Candidatus Saccharimonadales bacterium]
MANSPLPTTGSSQSQSATQSPQAGVQSISSGAKSSSVQPGTTTSLLSGSTSGVALRPTALPTVNLTNVPATSTQATTQAAPAKAPHHVNSALLGMAILLFVVAVVLFWVTNRSAKNTL